MYGDDDADRAQDGSSILSQSASSTPGRLLIVEDDADIAGLLARFLEGHGYAVSIAGDGVAMDRLLADGEFDLVLLDIMLPGETGLVLCRRLRAQGSIGIIMVTALAETTDRIGGLDLGADDYVCKPFDLDELEARIRAVLRRHPGEAGAVAEVTLAFADWQFQPQRRVLRAPTGVRVSLTGAEADLLLAFCQHPQAMLSREQLIEWTRGAAIVMPDRVIDLLVSRLRRKLSIGGVASDMIQTERAGGYLFRHRVTQQ